VFYQDKTNKPEGNPSGLSVLRREVSNEKINWINGFNNKLNNVIK
jgi:hypothetical protein